jgi:hypothetical protein
MELAWVAVEAVDILRRPPMDQAALAVHLAALVRLAQQPWAQVLDLADLVPTGFPMACPFCKMARLFLVGEAVVPAQDRAALVALLYPGRVDQLRQAERATEQAVAVEMAEAAAGRDI